MAHPITCGMSETRWPTRCTGPSDSRPTIPPNGSRDTAGPGDAVGAAAQPPGTGPELGEGSGVTVDTVVAQLGGTDNVLSAPAWPTLAEAPWPSPAGGSRLPNPAVPAMPVPASAPRMEPAPASSNASPW